MKKTTILGTLASVSLLALVACQPENATAEAAPQETTPAVEAVDTAAAEAVAAQLAETAAGVYNVEKTHAFLFWELSHGGLSTYTAKFTDWDASINFDPANPAASTVTASIDPTSVETDHPTKADEWHTELANDFFKAAEFPAITFNSTSAKVTGPNTGIVTGDLTFLGVTKTIDLDVTYNGVGNKPWLGDLDVIGFDATTTITRSDYGLTKHVDNGIGDEVTIKISAEFVQAEEETAAE
ncbi:YceI family protein [Hirschia baltica]|uniref:YceI family protein n=1 Tax=Hirschia baltica (strain ATCC 49814 / DSM 5838 / IFAM 1418) TaxID=582402 RepID=C6XI33_HIRBI|nr:YceI family protein [Hirschia baltica]ACT58859.1 YceI family protein [Hirschia baltica ATCC 49814]